MAIQESSASSTLHVTPAIFDRITGPLSQKKILIPLGLVLFSMPVILTIADGIFDQFQQIWRVLYIPPTIILYILILAPLLDCVRCTRMKNSTVSRKIAHAGDPQWIADRHEWPDQHHVTVPAVWRCLTKEIYRQPIVVNIFDLRPFEPVGRESLLLSFAFIVGATIAMAFSITVELVLTIESIIVYMVFALMTIVVFYANMIDTYRLLSDAKKRELNLVKDHISYAYRSFKQSAEEGQDIRTSVMEMNAWISMKERLVKAQTWPHSTATVGRLLISSLMPAGIASLRQMANAVLDSITLPF